MDKEAYCKNCRWYFSEKRSKRNDGTDYAVNYICKRHPPSWTEGHSVSSGAEDGGWRFPRPDSEDFCGDFASCFLKEKS